MRNFVRILLFATLGFLAPHAQAQVVNGLCGPVHVAGSYGPFDYRTATSEQKRLVEGAHFTPSIATLQKGKSSFLGGDIHYTLNVFPNHPRALLAMTRLSERLNTNQPPGTKYPVECYYFRALRFQPDDIAVRVLYAHFLIDRKRSDEAREELKRAEAGELEDPQVLYNIGLAYFDLKDYDRSLKYAQDAYRGGIRFSALKEKLRRIEKWRESD